MVILVKKFCNHLMCNPVVLCGSHNYQVFGQQRGAKSKTSEVSVVVGGV